jgi:hypothetical protein
MKGFRKKQKDTQKGDRSPLLEGSEARLDCRDQNMFSIWAKRKIRKGLNAWNQVDGTSRPKKFQFVSIRKPRLKH